MTAECREPNKTVTTAASAAGNNRVSIVLLTGATGYLGSRLASRLIADGMLVVVAKRSFSDLRRIKSIIPLDLMFDIDREPLEWEHRCNHPRFQRFRGHHSLWHFLRV